MKNFVYILLLYPFLLLIGCDNLSEKLCLLPNDSEWVFAQGGVSFNCSKVRIFYK